MATLGYKGQLDETRNGNRNESWLGKLIHNVKDKWQNSMYDSHIFPRDSVILYLNTIRCPYLSSRLKRYYNIKLYHKFLINLHFGCKYNATTMFPITRYLHIPTFQYWYSHKNLNQVVFNSNTKKSYIKVLSSDSR